MRTVQNILDSKTKPFNTVVPSTLVLDALKLLNSINLSYLVVMDGDEYKGIFSERDYSRNVILKGRSSSAATVAETMTTDLPIVSLNETAEYCMNMMNLHKTRYLLAFDEDEKLVGVITIHDLLRSVLLNKEQVFDDSLTKELIDRNESNSVY